MGPFSAGASQGTVCCWALIELHKRLWQSPLARMPYQLTPVVTTPCRPHLAVLQLGSSAPGSEAAKAAEAAAAAAAAAATARPAKLRQQQRQQQQQQQQPEPPMPAAVEPPSSSAGPAPAVVSPHTQPIRQRPQGPLGLVHEAVHGVQLALQRVLRGDRRQS